MKIRSFTKDCDDLLSVMTPPVLLLRPSKVRNILTFLQEMDSEQELCDISGWKVHQLTGDRTGTWSLTVTRNWRMTFKVDKANREICDLDYEDYH